jgi:2-oxoisovalerate dehydrogenase E2 component (dihydrolipoyl transacylase)
MIKDFKLPDLGEGLTESEIVKWQIAVGDTVELNQVIAEVETAKAVVDLPSPFAGKVTALHEEEGATVQVGAPIVSIDVVAEAGSADTDGGMPAEGAPASTGEGAAEAKPERQSVLVGYGPAAESDGRPKRRTRSGGSGQGSATPQPQPEPQAAPAARQEPSKPASADAAAARAAGSHNSKPAERPRSTPPVRKMAKDIGVDLTQVTGTGQDGLITRADVQAFADAGPAPVSGQRAPRSGDADTDQGRP